VVVVVGGGGPLPLPPLNTRGLVNPPPQPPHQTQPCHLLNVPVNEIASELFFRGSQFRQTPITCFCWNSVISEDSVTRSYGPNSPNI